MESILTTILTSGAVAIITGIITYLIQDNKLKKQFDLEREKLEEQYRTERQADAALKKFLNHVHFKRRSFDYIREKMGGFTDDELRKMLIRNGAIRSISKDKSEREWWEPLEKSTVEPEE